MTESYSGRFSLSNVQGIGTYITFSANEEAYRITGNNQFTSETGAIIKYEGNQVVKEIKVKYTFNIL